MSQENQIADKPYFYDLINKRSKRLETMFYDLEIILNQKEKVIEARKNKRIITKFYLKQDFEITKESLISFFLNLEESLLIAESLKKQLSNESNQIKVIDALYEYPFVDDEGNFFVYISDKGTGNRNPFVLNLLSYHEKEIIIPETGDYFPVLNKEILYFLKAVEDGFSLNTYHLITEEMTELIKGKINCLREHDGKIYYSEGNSIYQIDSQGKLIENYDFKNQIQSFDIYADNFILSMLNKNQYDLYSFNIQKKSLIQITNSNFNEMDVIFKNKETIIFSSNLANQYALYVKHVTNQSTKNEYHLLYQEGNGDLFYPFYSEYYSKVICSCYETGEEPKFLIFPY